MRSRFAALASIAGAAALLGAAPPCQGAAGATTLVSGPNAPAASGSRAAAARPAISGNGRFVAFSGAIGGGDPGVYLRDMSAGISPIDVPRGRSSQGLRLDAGRPSLSRDGRTVAFASEDPELSDEDRDVDVSVAGIFPLSDVFTYRRPGGAFRLVSRADGVRGASGNANSTDPALSADGRYVAFQTEASNFRHGAYGGVFVRDLRRHATRPVAWPDGPFNGGRAPSISAHGRRVAFQTILGRHLYEIAVRDMGTGRTTYVSRAAGRRGRLAAATCKPPAISADGRYVVFSTRARNLSRRDRDATEDIFMRDLKTARTILVSRARGKRGAAGDGDSSRPSISADGRYVAFESYATNLGPRDNGSVLDVFVRDMRSGRVFLASRGIGGRPANGDSAGAAISADGRYVAFASLASNLTPADPDPMRSVYRYRLPR